MNYYRRSIEVILQNQHSSGAYVASPAFSNYDYCWLRDGSFIAHSMDRVGEYQSAEAFFRWVNRAINKYAHKVDILEEQMLQDPSAPEKSILHTRYTLDGEEESTDSTWGNFQIDGYGTWLWALAEHMKLSGNFGLLNEFSNSITTTIRYLKAAWLLPNYDCWEEHPEYLHPYSLAAVYGGLNTIAGLPSIEKLEISQFPVADYAARVKDFLGEYAVKDSVFVKHVWPPMAGVPARPVLQSGVDSSLLGLVVPYQVFTLHDPMIQNTVAAIEKELHRPEGGVYRYKEDVYYGGGEWLLLTAWLGWVYAQNGDKDHARQLLTWIEANADSAGNMPEQVSKHTLAPTQLQPWIKKWGPIASPLLWSHAMYLILTKEIE
jgi:GH15 family glucan-1,4-alpha-glucosidase